MLGSVLLLAALLGHAVESFQLPGTLLGPESMLCKKRNPYMLEYRKDLPWGEDIIRDVQLDEITDGRATVIALHTAHCLYCTTQAKYLGNMARDLQDYGTNISIVIINRAGYESYIDYYMRHVKMFDHVYFMQDNYDTNAWRDLRGRKDDFYIYDTSQRLVKYATGRGVSLTNFGWKDELYDMLGRLGKGYSDCDEQDAAVQTTPGNQQFVESEFSFPRPDQCRGMSDAQSDTIRLRPNTLTLIYITDASVRYSVAQVKEFTLLQTKWKGDVNVVIINLAQSADFYSDLIFEVNSISETLTEILQDTPQLQLAKKLGVTRDDLLIYDSSGRLVFYNRAPKTDFLNSAWRTELNTLVTSGGNKFCAEMQLRELMCKNAEDWSYNDIPFLWMTFERFTVLTILKEGEDGVTQFEQVSDARSKMGHFPITHIVINPSTPGGLANSWKLRELEETSRVQLLQDYTQAGKSILNKLYAAPGDILYYDSEGVLRARDSYSLQYDVMSNIRRQYKAAELPCAI